ncbi:DNA cytosine methyltransferase [Acinetobacter celticus]
MHEISKTPFFNMLVDEFFTFPESTSNANFYKQAGNSVVVPVVYQIAKN